MSGSANMLLMASSDSNTNIFYLYSIEKSTGALVKTKQIDSTSRSAFSTANARQISQSSYQNLLADRWADVYVGINAADNSEMGMLRLTGFESSDAIDWYQGLSCTCMTTCKITSIIENRASTSYLYAASLIQDSTNTSIHLHHFGSDGVYYWSNVFS